MRRESRWETFVANHAEVHHVVMMKNRREKRSAFGLPWYNKAVFYGYTEKASFYENPDRVQVRARKSGLLLLLDLYNIDVRK